MMKKLLTEWRKTEKMMLETADQERLMMLAQQGDEEAQKELVRIKKRQGTKLLSRDEAKAAFEKAGLELHEVSPHIVAQTENIVQARLTPQEWKPKTDPEWQQSIRNAGLGNSFMKQLYPSKNAKVVSLAPRGRFGWRVGIHHPNDNPEDYLEGNFSSAEQALASVL